MKPRRKETAGDRFRLAIDMFRVGVSLKEAQLKREFPGASKRFIVGKIREWLVDKPPPGEGLRRVPWPRSKKKSSSRSRRR